MTFSHLIVLSLGVFIVAACGDDSRAPSVGFEWVRDPVASGGNDNPQQPRGATNTDLGPVVDAGTTPNATKDAAAEAGNRVDAAPDTGPVVTCSLSIGKEGCEQCVYNHCVVQCNACETDQACSAMLKCVTEKCYNDKGKIDLVCAQGCTSNASETTMAAFNALASPGGCGDRYCGGFCPLF